MANYALVQDKRVVNTVEWDGEEEVSFGNDVLAVLIPDGEAVSIGYSYDAKKFTAPALTDEQKAAQDAAIASMNITLKSTLMNEASQRISVLQDAVDLEMATDDETKALPLCKKYRVLLSRINADISSDVTWPDKPAF
ncbi:tail fiber assembly protein [Pantoea agglomerans]|uniref:tail fiber assembly protein n=1 Tax=Enterobacter agglomerans TaxID=549 RepID=UPI000E2116EF|nr:tail fiber assembly protein [Pantoea agglomerans]MCH9406345.1 tail fiber assembly protein [Pantoea agglomerans]WNK32140.1 tail fiber assembly protein [Pantoea agglomerans]WNK63951.1 tail fiber assembly protein [Pantoea agglomerans]